MARDVHWICRRLRQLRVAHGWSLYNAEQHLGISAVALGSYERGDRTPPLHRIDAILAGYGYSLALIRSDAASVRIAEDMADELRAIADQIEQRMNPSPNRGSRAGIRQAANR